MFGKPDDLIPFADDIFDTIFIGIRCHHRKGRVPSESCKRLLFLSASGIFPEFFTQHII